MEVVVKTKCSNQRSILLLPNDDGGNALKRLNYFYHRHQGL